MPLRFAVALSAVASIWSGGARDDGSFSGEFWIEAAAYRPLFERLVFHSMEGEQRVRSGNLATEMGCVAPWRLDRWIDERLPAMAAMGLIAMTGKAFEQEFPRLASWYERTVTNPFATVSHSAPLLEDAAFARHQLLAAVRGEELLAFTDTVSARAKHAGLLAGAIGARIANRKIAPHRAPVAA